MNQMGKNIQTAVLINCFIEATLVKQSMKKNNVEKRVITMGIEKNN